MRCVFQIELKVDIDASDDKLRAVFIDFVKQKARDLYGPAAMLAKSSPVVALSETSREGKRTLPLFDTPEDNSEE